MTSYAIWAGEQEGQKVEKERYKSRHRGEGGDNFTYTWTHPTELTKNHIWHEGSRRRCNRLFQILSG